MMKRTQRGFTLVELMLVMSIIILLVAILIPALQPNAQNLVAAQKRMESLHAQIEAFRSTFGVYPPSNNSIESNAGGTGAQCLFFYLVHQDSTGKAVGWKRGDSPWVTADWEPAMGVNKDWVMIPPDDSPYGRQPWFVDGIDTERAILYYRAAWKDSKGKDLSSSTECIGIDHYYTYKDNVDPKGASSDDNSPFWPSQLSATASASPRSDVSCGKQMQWYNEITDWSKTNQSYTNANMIDMTKKPAQRCPINAGSFMLISAGSDREFGMPSDTNRGWKCDDLIVP